MDSQFHQRTDDIGRHICLHDKGMENYILKANQNKNMCPKESQNEEPVESG